MKFIVTSQILICLLSLLLHGCKCDTAAESETMTIGNVTFRPFQQDWIQNDTSQCLRTFSHMDEQHLKKSAVVRKLGNPNDSYEFDLYYGHSVHMAYGFTPAPPPLDSMFVNTPHVTIHTCEWKRATHDKASRIYLFFIKSEEEHAPIYGYEISEISLYE